MYKKIKGQMSNRDAKKIAALEDQGECCGNCRFYKESRVTGRAVCRELRIRTNCICLCGRWKAKELGNET